MVSLPIAWEQEQPAASAAAETCPYTASEIRDLLADGQFHYLPDEPEAEFDLPGEALLSERRGGRAFWIFSANDSLGRAWFVLVGSGQSPFDSSEMLNRWMIAETNDDGISLSDFFDRQVQEQEDHDRLKAKTRH